MSMTSEHKDALQKIFNAGIEAVLPSIVLRKHLRVDGDTIQIGQQVFEIGISFQRIFVIGAGKASGSMAMEIESILGNLIHDGVVITKYGHELPLMRIKLFEASHPVPDQQSVRSTQKLIEMLESVTQNDLVICLWSGGASALMTDLPNDITLDDVKKLNELLLFSGCNIQEINTVRKHISQLKGGQLVRLCKNARIISFIISDVPGDDISVIASGPTVPDESDFQKAMSIVEHLDSVPEGILRRLKMGMSGNIRGTIKPDDPFFKKVSNYIIGSNQMALEAATKSALKLGYEVLILKSPVTGETEMKAIEFAEEILKNDQERKLCLIQGGETTITVHGNGKGGRNQHFALKTLQHLKRLIQHKHTDFISFNSAPQQIPDISILCAGTDGTDGPTDAAGAFAFLSMDTSIAEMDHALTTRDSYTFHQKYGTLFLTGPTHTNVMDVMIALIH